MRIRSIAVILCLSMATCIYAWAGDNPDQIRQSPSTEERKAGVVLPDKLKAYYELVQGEIDKKNALQYFSSDISRVQNNEDGTIKSVQYADGTVADYSYVLNAQGDVTSCTITTKDVQLSFNLDSDAEGKDVISAKVYVNPDSGSAAFEPVKGNVADKNVPAKPVVVVYYPAPKGKLEDIARKPIKFDFPAMKEAFSKVAKAKNAAVKEYETSMSVYYDKMIDKLGSMPGSTGKNADLSKLTKQARMEYVDQAVARAHEEARISKDDKTAQELIVFEGELRAQVIDPAQRVYEGRMAGAQKDVNKTVDELIDSRLAIYLDLKKDKMDAIINLPETSGKK